MSPLLEVEDLSVKLATGEVLLEGISYSVQAGQSLGIVGGPGSGKTVAALTMIGLTPGRSANASGRVLFEDRDLLSLPDEQLRWIRGNDIGITFQDPLSSLHPFYRVGWQVAEAILAKRRVSKSAARDRAIDLLELAGLPEPHKRVDRFPHELSADMSRRATIAIALANEPKLLVADEPATGLEASEQAEILELLAELRERAGMAMIILTRDQEVAARMADETYVLPSSST